MAGNKIGAKAAGQQAYNQVYGIINDAAKIMFGEQAPTVQDSASLVGLGAKILPYDQLSINFIGTLFARIGKTIIETRAYKSTHSFLMYDDFEWGGIVQKIDTEVPDAVEDASLNLEEGKSVDMYIVAKPTAKMKFFWQKSAYTFFMTIQRKWLKDAFTSAQAMGAFLNAIEVKMRNKLEIANENMGRLTMGNMACLLKGTHNEIHTITEYVAATGNTAPPADARALHDPAFLRFLTELVQNTRVDLSVPNKIWNLEGNDKFSNPNDLSFVVLSRLNNAMKANVEYSAYHKEAVSLGNYVEVPFWLSPQKPFEVNLRVNTAMNQEAPTYANVKIENLIGIMFDRRAAGTYRTETEVATTPYNARGRYTNTFWHEDNMWFNDMGEQAVIFTLT